MTNNYLIRFAGQRLGYGRVEIRNTAGRGIRPGITAILGANGAGKTTLGTILAKGRYAFGNRLEFAREGMTVKMLAFTDIHSFTGIDVVHYAQRMEATANDYVPTVADILGPKATSPRWAELCGRLGLRDVAAKRVNYLSSGEQRKLLIVNALLDEPDLLILDNPYIGLDAPSRAELDALMQTVEADVVLLVSDPADVPAFATDRIYLDCCEIVDSLPEAALPPLELPAQRPQRGKPFRVAFEIVDGHASYGGRQIISGLNWRVGRGEQWALVGPNGSGKSLLLSMVCGDNPQAYANRITLFDRPRGSGETIWEIKDRIGFLSPEMQLFFKSDKAAEAVVVEGMRPALNRFASPTDAELAEARGWLRALGAERVCGRRYAELSSGEQRLVLLARALAGQPELLVLDEPLHGLDAAAKRRAMDVVAALAERNASALIYVSHYAAEIPRSVAHTKRLC